MGNLKQTTTTKTNMSINKLTLAALAAAYANGVQISSQSKDVFSDIGNWFENDFVDFWTDDFVGAFEDLGDWFAGDFADWWTDDFVDFWTDDIPEFFEQEIPEILGLGPSDEEIAEYEQKKAEAEALKA